MEDNKQVVVERQVVADIQPRNLHDDHDDVLATIGHVANAETEAKRKTR